VARAKDRLFIGVGSHVVALDYSTGTELWRTKLKASSYVTVSLVGNRVLGGAGGEVFCLDASTGRILWHNRLKGLGHGVVSFSGSDEITASAAMRAAQGAAAG
jgi:outer membrane protein assembly factor BamB